MSEETTDLLARIRLLARVIEDEMTESDLAMPSGLLRAEAMDYLAEAGYAEHAMLLMVDSDYDIIPVYGNIQLVERVKELLNSVMD